MQVTINTEAVAAALGAIAGAGTAAGVIWARVTRPARRFMTWLTEFREDWTGVEDRPGVPGRPGMMVRMAAIEAEFRPNGGQSLRDRVNLIDRRQVEHEKAHAAATVAVAAALNRDVGNGGERAAA